MLAHRIGIAALTVLCVAVTHCAAVRQAEALEKYGRPLPSLDVPSSTEREAEESLFGGYLLTAPFVHNPTFAARPDNTGLVGMRHMIHVETDLYKQYLTFYTDQNFFSDRRDGWIKLSEWDSTYAFTGIVDQFGWRIQFERDSGLDRKTLTQEYADVLGTATFEAVRDTAWWRKTFPHQNLTAYAGVGWLFHNSSYFARPNNTGRALYRYVAHADLDLYKNKVVLFGDINMFTDRQASAISPSELDWIIGLAVRWRNTELAVYREEDRPLDRSGLIQKYVAVQLRYSFDVPKRWAKELGLLK